MMIGVIDFGIEKIFHRPNIIYDWNECITIALIIEIMLLPFINFRRKWPILFGKDARRVPSILA
jgi:hypothetical protein